MMNLEGLLKLVVQKFEEKKISYALIGGFALHAAGYHRATGDLDFLIHVDHVKAVKNILTSLGYNLIHESEDVLNLSSPWGFIGGIDFIKAHRKYALAMLKRAKPYSIEKNLNIPAIIPEDIIGLKLQAMSNDSSRFTRDLADIEWIMGHYWGKLKMDLVEEYFKIFSLDDELDRITEKIKNAK